MRLIHRLASLWAVLGGAILLAIVAVTAINTGGFALDRIARLWDGNVAGLPGYEDFVRLAIGAAVPMFLPWCQVQRGHLAVDLFLARLPGLARIMDRIALVLIAVTAAALCYWMTLGMLESHQDGALSRVLGWPEWPFFLTGIASLAFWAVIALAQLVSGEDAAPEVPHG